MSIVESTPIVNPTSTIVEEIKSAVDESVTEIKEAIVATEATEEDHWSKLSEVVAEKVYDKVKKLVTDLLDAAEDAAEAIAETIEAPPEAAVEAVTEETSDEDVPPKDVAPKRGHVLFRKAGKKENN